MVFPTRPSFVDKTNRLQDCLSSGSLILELGVGNKRINPDALGIDLIDSPAVDLIGDVFDILSSLPSNCVSHMGSSHFIEHIDSFPVFLKEIIRVAQPKCTLKFTAPHFSNPFYYSDPTHRNFYGLYTFNYYATCSLFARTIPTYSQLSSLYLYDISLSFRSHRPHYIRHILGRFFSLSINSTRWSQEFYEECLCWVLPCFEVTYFI